MINLHNKNTLMQQLAKGAYVVTPNNRLSAAVIEDYYERAGEQTLDKPHCLPLQTFIQTLYQDILLSYEGSENQPMLLSSPQCRYLWQSILSEKEHLTYSKGLLDAIMDAWKRCVQWMISPSDSAFSYNNQCLEFQDCWKTFNQRLKHLNAHTEEELINFIMHSKVPLKPRPLIWACFDEFTPQQQAFQAYMIQQNSPQSTYDLMPRESRSQVFAAANDDAELKQLFHWIEQRLEAGDKKIAVVIPDLQQQSRSLQRQLKAWLSPSLYNLSLGRPLRDYPLVSHALNVLALDGDEITHKQLRLLLSSPYFKGSKVEFHQRTNQLQYNKLLRQKQLSIKQWLDQAEGKPPLLSKAMKALERYPETASPLQWVECFHKRLKTLGYPGDYPLDSENYQCFQRFSELFNQLRQLSLIKGIMSRSEAIDALDDLAQRTIFQAQTTHQKPVQISGLLEASGCEFDSLWIMGLTDQTLPQKPKLSAFIPQALQREKNMPHSSPEREWLFAKGLIQRFKKASPINVFSYPQMTGDTAHLKSPLINHLELFCPDIYQPQDEEIYSITALERIQDDYLIPLSPDEAISGGTALLSNQAKCPFRAFAAHRLHAKAARPLSEGLDPIERGEIAHKVMELIWLQLKTQKQLLSLNAKTLENCIESAITAALSPFVIHKNDRFPVLMQAIELTRLKRLVHQCLDFEKQRPPFEIHAIEKDYIKTIHGLDIKVRVDRIDQVDEDKKWVIDYKSTIPSSKPWNEDRPKEPQLLLYALLDESINTLMFLQLKSGQIESMSISEDNLDLKGHTELKDNESWSDYRAHWEQQLELIAKEFSEGYCPPEPLNRSICELCDFQNLCRYLPE